MAFAIPLRRRSLAALAFFVSILTLTILVSFAHSDQRKQFDLPFGFGSVVADPEGLHQEQACSDDIDYLRRARYEFSRQVKYQRVCVKPQFDDTVDRDVVAAADGPKLEEGGVVLNLADRCKTSMPLTEGATTIGCQELKVAVPRRFPQQDYSDIVFAVATSYDRLRDSLPYFKHWMANTNAQFLAVISGDNDSDRKLKGLSSEFGDAGIDLLAVRPYNDTIGVNAQHFTMIRDVLQHSKKDRKWIGIIDDDTFFPSLYPLRQAIEKTDASKPAYLGMVSENAYNVEYHGYMAFGGAGAFISWPLAKALDPEIESCLNSTHVREGDALLRICIESKSDVKLTEVEGLHQLDMSGDMSGFYESGRFPLSLHHWKSWHRAPVDRMALVAQFCGGCFLQRWRVNSNVVFTNGFSVAMYADGTKDLELDNVEGTWDGAEHNYEESFGPLRDKLDKSKKKSYKLVDAEQVGSKLRQIYVHKASGGEDSRTDEVIEFLWDWPS